MVSFIKAVGVIALGLILIVSFWAFFDGLIGAEGIVILIGFGICIPLAIAKSLEKLLKTKTAFWTTLTTIWVSVVLLFMWGVSSVGGGLF